MKRSTQHLIVGAIGFLSLMVISYGLIVAASNAESLPVALWLCIASTAALVLAFLSGFSGVQLMSEEMEKEKQ